MRLGQGGARTGTEKGDGPHRPKKTTQTVRPKEGFRWKSLSGKVRPVYCSSADGAGTDTGREETVVFVDS